MALFLLSLAGEREERGPYLSISRPRSNPLLGRRRGRRGKVEERASESFFFLRFASKSLRSRHFLPFFFFFFLSASIAARERRYEGSFLETSPLAAIAPRSRGRSPAVAAEIKWANAGQEEQSETAVAAAARSSSSSSGGGRRRGSDRRPSLTLSSSSFHHSTTNQPTAQHRVPLHGVPEEAGHRR